MLILIQIVSMLIDESYLHSNTFRISMLTDITNTILIDIVCSTLIQYGISILTDNSYYHTNIICISMIIYMNSTPVDM